MKRSDILTLMSTAQSMGDKVDSIRDFLYNSGVADEMMLERVKALEGAVSNLMDILNYCYATNPELPTLQEILS